MFNRQHLIPDGVLQLFENIARINEDDQAHENKIQSTINNVLAIERILQDHPEFMFYKKDGIRLVGTWIYCYQISPFDYALLQSRDDTWKYMCHCVLTNGNDEMREKLLMAFTEFKGKDIQTLDCSKVAYRLDKFNQNYNLDEMFSDNQSLGKLKKSLCNVNRIKLNKPIKNHSKFHFLTSLVHGSKDKDAVASKHWCESVVKWIEPSYELKNEMKK